jgi:Fic family protein
MVLGKIYKIVDKTNNNVYIGSTGNDVKQRMHQHRANYKRYINGKSKNKCKSFEIIKNNNYECIIIEQLDDCTTRELTERETYFIEITENCVNTLISNATKKINYKGDKEDMLAFHKEYHKEYKKEYRRKKMIKSMIKTIIEDIIVDVCK